MKDTSSFLDLALDDSMGFDPLGAFDDDVEEDAEEVTGGYLGTPHTGRPGARRGYAPGPRRSPTCSALWRRAVARCSA